MDNLLLVPAREEDFSACMEILRSGREFQRQQGFVQWPDGYPTEQRIRADIREGNGYVLKVDGVIAAYFYLGFSGDPAYPEIRGKWQNDEPYAVIHRIAIGSNFRNMGLSAAAFRLAEELCLQKGFRNLRIDTLAQNKRMQHVLTKNGFVYRGLVTQDNGDRLAFDKQLAK